MAEYLVLHTYVLTGGDRLGNMPKFLGFVFSAIAVSVIAARFGGRRRGQLLSAAVCVTLPNGILQASGAKNDYLLAAFLAAMVYFAFGQSRRDLLFSGLALALAVFTKATAYLFAPPLLAALWIPRVRREPGSVLRAASFALLAILLVNGTFYVRNIRLGGSPSATTQRKAMGSTVGRTTGSAGERRLQTPHVTWRTRWAPGALDGTPAFLPRLRHFIASSVSISTIPAPHGQVPRLRLLATRITKPTQTPLASATDCGCRRCSARAVPRSARLVPCRGLRRLCPILLLPEMAALPRPNAASVVRTCVARSGSPARKPRAGVDPLLFNKARPYLFENWIRPLKGAACLLRPGRTAISRT